MQIIDTTGLVENAVHPIKRKDSVVVRVQDHQGTRRHERSDLTEIPAVSVHVKHAVAMTFHHSMCQPAAVGEAGVHMILQIRYARHRCGYLDALIKHRNPPTVSSATASAGDAKPLLINKL